MYVHFNHCAHLYSSEIERLEIYHRNSPQSFSNQFLVIRRGYLTETSQ